MRVFAVFSIVLVSIAFLFAGCGGDEEEGDLVGADEQGGAEEVYLGFSSMEAGEWAEYTDSIGARYKLEYHGTDTYDGRECFIMEFETSSAGISVIGQLWIEKSTGECILYVMKQGGMVIKLDVSQVPEVAEEVSEEVPSGAEKLGVEDYKTPTGKTVKATVYRENGDEIWVSGGVPFGSVKSVVGGEVLMELYDFGSSGAKKDISKEEAVNAQSMVFPGG